MEEMKRNWKITDTHIFQINFSTPQNMKSIYEASPYRLRYLERCGSIFNQTSPVLLLLRLFFSLFLMGKNLFKQKKKREIFKVISHFTTSVFSLSFWFCGVVFANGNSTIVPPPSHLPRINAVLEMCICGRLSNIVEYYVVCARTREPRHSIKLLKTQYETIGSKWFSLFSWSKQREKKMKSIANKTNWISIWLSA